MNYMVLLLEDIKIVPNKAVQLSARRLVFQPPGSGQEFAAAMGSVDFQDCTAAQFLPLRLGSRYNCLQRIPRARPAVGTGAN